MKRNLLFLCMLKLLGSIICNIDANKFQQSHLLESSRHIKYKIKKVQNELRYLKKNKDEKKDKD